MFPPVAHRRATALSLLVWIRPSRSRSARRLARKPLARSVEEEAIVLLKNDASALPLDRTSVHTVALVGALANTANTGDTGSRATMSS